jgi:hypothetical protein
VIMAVLLAERWVGHGRTKPCKDSKWENSRASKVYLNYISLI